jgi:competence CoiA-like predicted nuclease
MLAAVYRDNPEEQVVPCLEEHQDTLATQEKVRGLVPSLVCPECGAMLEAALGKHTIWHFKHARGTQTNCELRDGESQEHLALKLALYLSAKRLFPRAKLRFETWLPEAKRKADVLMTMPDGARIALEGQRSSIMNAKFEERTLAYVNASIDVVWAFNREQYSKRVVPGMSWWLIDHDLMVLAAAVSYHEEHPRIRFELFTVEERSQSVPRSFEITEIRSDSSNLCWSRRFLRAFLKNLNFDSRVHLERLQQMAFDKGYEVHIPDIIKLVNNAAEFRYLNQNTFCLSPWYILKQPFRTRAVPNAKDRIEEDNALAEMFWLEYWERSSNHVWLQQLEDFEPNPDVQHRVKLKSRRLVEAKLLAQTEATNRALEQTPRSPAPTRPFDGSSQPPAPTKIKSQLSKAVEIQDSTQLEDGVISRKRLEARNSSPWMQMRVYKGQFLFLKIDGQETRTTKEHFHSWLGRLKHDIERGRHLNGLVEIGELGQKLLTEPMRT